MKAYRATKHVPWVHYKSIVATASALGVTERTSAHLPSDGFKIAEGMNYLEGRISCSDSTLSATAHVYAARIDDDISHVGDIAITVGDQVSGNPLAGGASMYYVDTMVLTDKWIGEVHLADENGNNGMSRFVFDVTGYDIVFVVITFSGSNKTWRIDFSGF